MSKFSLALLACLMVLPQLVHKTVQCYFCKYSDFVATIYLVTMWVVMIGFAYSWVVRFNRGECQNR